MESPVPSARPVCFWTRKRRAIVAITAGTVGGLLALVLAHRTRPPLPRVPLQAALNILVGVQKTVYPDGLTLITRENHAAPVVSVWLCYKVGHRDEMPATTGISHLAEHMMFEGTQRLSAEDTSRILFGSGAAANAFTAFDYTAYHETLPSAGLLTILKLEADRMEHAAFRPASFEKEKGIVAAELEGYQNIPLRRLQDAVRATAFRHHPYGGTELEALSVLKRLTCAQVLRYYSTHYAPNNAVLVITGDFKTAALKRLVAKLFRDVPARSIDRRPIPQEPQQTSERRVQIRGAGGASLVEIAYRAPAITAPDYAALDVAAKLLYMDGRGSLSRLSDRGLAMRESVWDTGLHDPYLMAIDVTVNHGHTPAEVERVVEQQVDRLKTDGISDRRLSEIINRITAAYIYNRADMSATASALAYWDVLGGDNNIADYLRRLQKVTPADVRAAARRYLVRSNRTVGYFIPDGAPLQMSRTAPADPHADEMPGAASTGVSSAKPGETTAPYIQAPPLPRRIAHGPVYRRVLRNGMVVIVYPDPASPIFNLRCELNAGAADDPPLKAGLARLTATAVERWTNWPSGHDLAGELAIRAGGINMNTDEESTIVDGSVLANDRALLIEILADTLRRPHFSAGVVNGGRQQLEALAREREASASLSAERRLYTALYPASDPLHWPISGDARSMAKISLQDVERFYGEYYRPDRTVLVVTGPVQPYSVVSLVTRYFGDWKAVGGPTPAGPHDRVGPASPVLLTEAMVDQPEVSVQIGCRALKRQDPLYYAALLMNEILGSELPDGRIAESLRDRQGLVYRAQSSLFADSRRGDWIATLQCSPDHVNQAVASVIAEMRKMRQAGATVSELEFFKRRRMGAEMVRLSSDSVVAQRLCYAERYGLGLDYPWLYPAKIAAVTPTELRAAARRALDPDHLVISVAGSVSRSNSHSPSTIVPITQESARSRGPAASSS